MKEAKIKCPHCGAPITVRSLDGQPNAQEALQFWEAVDEMCESVDRTFKKVFDPKNWKW